MVLLAAVLGTASALWALQKVSQPSAQATPVQSAEPSLVGQQGPWGQLEYIPIEIEPPDEYVDVERLKTEPPAWYFKGFSQPHLVQLLESAPLSPSQRAVLLDRSRWESFDEGTVIKPDASTILTLDDQARQTIYQILARSERNEAQRTPYSIPAGELEDHLRTSGLAEDLRQSLRSLLYRQGEMLLFADLEVLLPRIKDMEQRRRLFQTVARRQTMLVKLQVRADSDIDALVNYWGRGRRAKSLRPLLESLQRVAGGCTIDLAHLLTGSARKRLYTYPAPTTDSVISRRDCHWTSLNFFSDPADDAFTDVAHVKRVLESEFEPITSEPVFGDLVLLMTPQGVLEHSAVYLADDLVFTKNGAIAIQPWMYMKIDQMLEYYQTFHPPEERLKVVIVRRKSGAQPINSDE